MVIRFKSHMVGYIIGIKRKCIFVFLGESNIGIISKQFFKNRKFFIGQLISGKLETSFSNLIKFKISKELKTNLLFKKGKFDCSLDQNLSRNSKNFTLNLFGQKWFSRYFIKLGKLLEYENVLGVNGYHNFSTNYKHFTDIFINKIFLNNYMSL